MAAASFGESLMHIVCPHCTTSYAIDPSNLGEAGRTVRCSRCKEVWLARADDDVRSERRVPAMAAAEPEADNRGWGDLDSGAPPEIDSPSIVGEMPASDTSHDRGSADTAEPRVAIAPDQSSPSRSFARARKPSLLKRLRAALSLRAARPAISLPTACAAMGALVLALLVWRGDVVRLLPQTAAFYKAIGLPVNLRGLEIKDVRISTETVDGKPVLVIEGAIFDVARKPVELPRLRFVVRDERGTEIYAWSALLEQPVLKPGEKAWFRSRLASPPPEARSIDVRFFNRRDIGAGGV
jgi:predicted Zn finger-like uncharacterized protein